MIWNILVLMAGDGKRFSNVGYDIPKPLIKTKNKTILEWTTNSLPFIKHHGCSKENLDYNLTFAIRQKHDKNGDLTKFLKETYGEETKIVSFPQITRGAMETAVLSLDNKDLNKPLLILDADNKYNGDGFLNFISKINEKEYGALCCFNPLDDSEKWCFVNIDNSQRVLSLAEKKKMQNGMPIVGVYFFSKKKTFLKASKRIIRNDIKINNEFYMSQSMATLLLDGVPIYAHITDSVEPLGTPEDLMRFEK